MLIRQPAVPVAEQAVPPVSEQHVRFSPGWRGLAVCLVVGGVLGAGITYGIGHNSLAVGHRYTKEQFEREIAGKTKAEIRAEFGSPYRVWDDPEDGTVDWSYDDLQIYDADAGSRVEDTMIEFAPRSMVLSYGWKPCDANADQCVAGAFYK